MTVNAHRLRRALAVVESVEPFVAGLRFALADENGYVHPWDESAIVEATAIARQYVKSSPNDLVGGSES